MLLFYAGPRLRGDRLSVFVDDRQRRRLAQTCFRPKDIGPRAGNFCRWRRMEEVFHDRMVRRGFEQAALETLSRHADRILDANRTVYENLTVDAGRTIGWSSSAPIEDEDPEAGGFPLAPPTRLATFRCAFRHEYTERYGPEWKTIIHAAYPGPDVGEGVRDGRLVILPWESPGVPIAV